MATENGDAAPVSNGVHHTNGGKRLKLTDIDEETLNSGAEG